MIVSNLLGTEINAGRIITYAACCGYTTYERIIELGLEKRFPNY